MFYLILGVCAVSLTAVHLSYWFKKHRLLDREIDAAIAKKLRTSEVVTELATLREERAVMRNLIHDILENEASVGSVTPLMAEDERIRLFTSRNERRRELFGESLAVLGQLPEMEWRKSERVL